MDITLICTALTELPLLALLKLGDTVILPADFRSSAVAGTSIWATDENRMSLQESILYIRRLPLIPKRKQRVMGKNYASYFSTRKIASIIN
jgi:hypothetical protein